MTAKSQQADLKSACFFSHKSVELKLHCDKESNRTHMKQLVITVSIATLIVVSGCTFPGEPGLRIAISSSPGSSLLYVAQDAGLFDLYGAKVHLVELNSACESAIALTDNHVDAVVIPFSEYNALAESGIMAGIVMTVASPLSVDSTTQTATEGSLWTSHEAELLIAGRSELMTKKQEWQRILLAFEHARLLMVGERSRQTAVVAKRERRMVEKVQFDLDRWNLFGIAHQDSLFSKSGPCASFSAQWHGKHLLHAAVASQFDRFSSANETAAARDKVR